MDQSELDMLLKLRAHVVLKHQGVLRESGGQNTAIVSARDAADVAANSECMIPGPGGGAPRLYVSE